MIYELLRYAAGRDDLATPSGNDQADPARDRQFQYMRDAGLAPLLQRAVSERAVSVPATWIEPLLAESMTAQVRQGARTEATAELLDTCQRLGVTVTLLKGISISDQFYPAPHLRPMGDIDVLVGAEDRGRVEAALVSLGYWRDAGHPRRPTAHHGAPLFDPGRRVLIEVHSALFPEDDILRQNALFSAAHVSAHSVASVFDGRPVNRLDAELQFVYLATSWVRNLSRNGFHPTFVPALFDAVYMLKASGHTLNWDEAFEWLDNELARCYLYLMLRYVDRLELTPFDLPLLPRLSASENRVGPVELRLIDSMLDKYLVGGAPFTRVFNSWHATIVLDVLLAPRSPPAKLALIAQNIAFPPRIEDARTFAYQLGRVARFFRNK